MYNIQRKQPYKQIQIESYFASPKTQLAIFNICENSASNE